MPKDITRAGRIREQIAHFKVLYATQDEALSAALQEQLAATKRVMVFESSKATFGFRIEELQDELERLTKKPVPR